MTTFNATANVKTKAVKTVSLSKQSLLAISLCGIALLNAPVMAADYSVGAGIGTFGFGVGVSGKTSWHFNDHDQIQWRAAIGGIDIGDIEDTEVNGVEYNADVENQGFQGGLEWYPFRSGFAKSLFFSGGIAHMDFRFDGRSELNESFDIGGTRVRPGDGRQIQTTIEQDGFAPYFTVGWGNRIGENSGLSFRAEAGVMTPFNDPEVEVRSVGTTAIAQNDLDRERRDIEDDIDTVSGFLSIGINYQF